jgi:predicted Zn-dependent protease
MVSVGVAVTAQDITGGGSLLRDITGGAALIFRAPSNPTVQLSAATGGGKVKIKNKPPVRKQDPILAKANAARSAPKPRYDEAEQQYRLAAQIAPDDARAFAGLGNIYVDQGRFADAVESYQKALKIKPDYNGAYLPLAFSLARLNRYPEASEIHPFRRSITISVSLTTTVSATRRQSTPASRRLSCWVKQEERTDRDFRNETRYVPMLTKTSETPTTV